MEVVTGRGQYFVNWLATMEVTCVILAVFKTFAMVILWLEGDALVRADLKPPLMLLYLLVSSTFPR
jgi:hypothetical protein